MSFLEHLDEFRRRLLWSVASVALAFCVCWTFATELYEIAIIVAAVVTPTTDFGNMLVIAGPMIVLYLVGVMVAWVFGKPRASPA